jgi:hypothetical protein
MLKSEIGSYMLVKASSPNSYTGNSTRSKSTRNSPRSYLSSNPCDTPVKKNMRIMTDNFRSIKDKRAEFETALLYLSF